MTNFSKLLIIYVVMIAVMILPLYFSNKKKRKQHDNLMNSLKIGVKIVSIGGIHGKVTKIHENEVDMEIDKGVILKLSKSAISRIEDEK